MRSTSITAVSCTSITMLGGSGSARSALNSSNRPSVKVSFGWVLTNSRAPFRRGAMALMPQCRKAALSSASRSSTAARWKSWIGEAGSSGCVLRPSSSYANSLPVRASTIGCTAPDRPWPFSNSMNCRSWRTKRSDSLAPAGTIIVRSLSSGEPPRLDPVSVPSRYSALPKWMTSFSSRMRAPCTRTRLTKVPLVLSRSVTCSRPAASSSIRACWRERPRASTARWLAASRPMRKGSSRIGCVTREPSEAMLSKNQAISTTPPAQAQPAQRCGPRPL